MTADPRLLVCAVGSILGHIALARGLTSLPPRDQRPPRARTVEVRLTRPPEPEPARPVPPAAREPKARVAERVRAAPPRSRPGEDPPKETSPLEHPPIAAESDAVPVFGVSMESTSRAGGPPMPIGNTTRPTPRAGASPALVAPLAEPVPAHEVTKMPVPQGRCSGEYTPEARAAGLEGTVVLDLIVGEDGRVRDIEVVEGLGGGLTKAAIAALAQCRFTPGEKVGRPVPVRIRGFKIRFLLPDRG